MKQFMLHFTSIASHLFASFSVCLGIFILLPSIAHASTTAITNQRWQTSLTSSKSYNNPYTDVSVSVTFTGPNSQSFSSLAFWDGGNTFLIRALFPQSGTWTWKTSSSDTANSGLHNQSGSVSVSAYSGTNPLYRSGLLKTSSNNRYLTHADGTPFLWMGDTAWIAPQNASYSQWQQFIQDRQQKDFSVIHVSAYSIWSTDTRSTNHLGQKPFTGSGITQVNPAYWQEYDKFVEYANNQGLVMFIVGLSDPGNSSASVADASRFARYLTARLHGNHVILSPSFDDTYASIHDQVGQAIKEATSVHLVTQHPNTPYHPSTNTTAHSYRNKSYLDFSANQTGHNSGDRNRNYQKAVEWNLALHQASPIKPTINTEAFYDANGTTSGMEAKYQGTAKDARDLGYLSWLSGSLGYSYGAYGLWNWQMDSSKPYHWSKAINYPSSNQMKVMTHFFQSLDWTSLLPDHSLITNQSTTQTKRMAFARNEQRTLGVAYLPDNPSISLNLSGFALPLKVTWTNPVTGQSQSAPDVTSTGTKTFNRPGAGDWTLLIKSSQNSNPSPTPVPTQTTLDGDYDQDGDVDFLDYTRLVKAFLTDDCSLNLTGAPGWCNISIFDISRLTQNIFQ